MLCVLLLMLFSASSDVGSDFAVDDGPAFFAYDRATRKSRGTPVAAVHYRA
jgi:hypothetical protein